MIHFSFQTVTLISLHSNVKVFVASTDLCATCLPLQDSVHVFSEVSPFTFSYFICWGERKKKTTVLVTPVSNEYGLALLNPGHCISVRRRLMCCPMAGSTHSFDEVKLKLTLLTVCCYLYSRYQDWRRKYGTHDKMKTDVCCLAVRVYLALMPSCTHLPLHVEHTRTKNVSQDPGHASYDQCLGCVISVSKWLLTTVSDKFHIALIFLESLQLSNVASSWLSEVHLTWVFPGLDHFQICFIST